MHTIEGSFACIGVEGGTSSNNDRSLPPKRNVVFREAWAQIDNDPSKG
jgi:hypothetical protein